MRSVSMKELVLFAAVMGGWIALNRWILPRMGVAT